MIAGLSSLATRQPVLAGYLIALPISTILALSFAYLQSGNGETVARFALSVFSALPVTLMFFVPFFFYSRFKGSYWVYLLAGIAMLYVGFFVHRAIAARLVQ